MNKTESPPSRLCNWAGEQTVNKQTSKYMDSQLVVKARGKLRQGGDKECRGGRDSEV